MNLDASMEVAGWVWRVDVGLIEETTLGSATSEALPSINDVTMDDNSFVHQSLSTKTHKDAYTGTHTFLKYKKCTLNGFGTVLCLYSCTILLMYYRIKALSYFALTDLRRGDGNVVLQAVGPNGDHVRCFRGEGSDLKFSGLLGQVGRCVNGRAIQEPPLHLQHRATKKERKSENGTTDLSNDNRSLHVGVPLPLKILYAVFLKR